MKFSVLDQDDTYREQAREAQDLADRTINDADKAAWLRIARSWLALIRRPKQTDRDAVTKARGTGQDTSNGAGRVVGYAGPFGEGISPQEVHYV